jgi:hypothetical protein
MGTVLVSADKRTRTKRVSAATGSMSSVAVFTGGTITTDDTYVYHAFTAGGTLALIDPGEIEVDYLVVAGGGGGAGRDTGGGGGAGGLLTGTTTVDVSTAVVVGAGGSGGTTPATAANTVAAGDGGNSSFGSIVATGGGGGGPYLNAGRAGGSGGGGGRGDTSNAGGAGTSGQGNAGGNGSGGTTTSDSGGGGGGAGAAGQNGAVNQAGNGGAGVDMSAVFGTSYGVAGWFAGGGGGATHRSGTANVGTGGAGGGGDAADTTAADGQSGVANTGGGGGASRSDNTARTGGNGGSGVVVVRYDPTQFVPASSFDPASIADLQLWLDASDTSTITDAGAGAVSAWNDKSGNARHLEQATAGLRPTTGVRTQNGRNVVDFAGDWMAMSTFDIPVMDKAFTLMMVLRWDTLPPSNAMGVFYGQRSGQATDINTFMVERRASESAAINVAWGTGLAGFNGTAFRERKFTHGNIHNFHVMTVTVDTVDGVKMYYDGTPITLTDQSTGMASLANFLSSDSTAWKAHVGTRHPGAGSTEPFDGAIGEVVCYNRVLSAGERDGVEAYLANKWLPNPAQMGEPFFWYDSADTDTVVKSGTQITLLRDKILTRNLSNNGNAFTHGVETQNGLPLIRTQNNGGLRFDHGSNGIASTGELTLFTVFRPQSWANFQRIFTLHNTGDNDFGVLNVYLSHATAGNGEMQMHAVALPARALSAGAWVVAAFKGSTAGAYQNWNTVEDSDATSRTLGPWRYINIGATTSNTATVTMDVAEIIGSRRITDTDLDERVFAYLRSKWDI